jgi:hypothetical protein
VWIVAGDERLERRQLAGEIADGDAPADRFLTTDA